jgi:hypothetical protein
VETRLDPVTELIPHRADPRTGAPLQGARGSSQALLLRFLLEIDPKLGRQHYVAFRSQFVAPGWLLPGTREYPVGTNGHGDVDSGPLIDGVSLSASVVSIAPARLVGDEALIDPYLSLGEAMGLPISCDGRRRYLLGQLPVADAFLVYARTATAWTETPAVVETGPIVPEGWRIGWHIVTLVPLIIALWLMRPWCRRSESERLP